MIGVVPTQSTCNRTPHTYVQPRACDPVDTTFDLLIYPPGQRLATSAAFDFEACSHAGVDYMGIDGPIRAGVGTING
jgi:hypothetical protein